MKATKAIGVFTKISLKNQVDDLMSKFSDYYQPSPDIARQTLEKVQRISKPFGTNIAVENGVGVIRVSSASTR